MENLILISIKEKYVKEILSGKKTIELRKAMPKAKEGDTILIYTTKPVMAVTAVATVEKIISKTPLEMWNQHHETLGINRKEFDAYYEKAKKAIGIKLKDVEKLNAEILLSAIKLIQPRFSPPQTFKYLNKFSTLRDFKSIIKH